MDRPTETTSTASEGGTAPLTVRCWGTRGSIPSPGPHTQRYGGNTSCVELRSGERRLILDAGSGIRLLGHDLVRAGGSFQHIFLTHFHWDHIQGFPFFPPLYRPGVELTIVAPRQKDMDVKRLFAGQMGPIYFPVPFGLVSAKLSFAHVGDEPWHVDGMVVRALRVQHPSNVVGYRVEAAGRVVCFVPDNDLEGEGYDVGVGWRRKLLDFVRGADLLVHDAMYTEEEYAARSGWGHSTFRQALHLAEEAGVERLLFFHHDPERTDDALDGIVARLRDDAGARGCAVAMGAAAEGIELGFDGEDPA